MADKLMTDFCYELGSVETGMPVVKRQFERAGVDVKAPTTESLERVIDYLAHVERDFKGPEEIEANRRRRLDWLAGKDWD